jgi:hypothetical protein
MSIEQWVLGYVVDLLFCLWVIRWGGARWLEGTFASGFLISWFAPRWSAEGIRLFTLLSLIGSSVWFVVGLFAPDARF